ncbi:MAG: aminoacyl-histidine dipeptidase [Prevotellaceae bacterium]|jgi:dipeptidase D|nr:aminoacyl-histidine dipeptidase [Prevotellaceae bacterium]
MAQDILSLKPAALWQHFYELTQIPRPSKHEAKASEFVAAFGKKLGLPTEVDGVGNVLIRKPATKGLEGRQTVILQGHLDMVPQANAAANHNFLTDPIDAYIDGEFVRARGTTLGADNGIGVAAAMALLEATDIEHPALEALFTIDEEAGMNGVRAIKAGWLKGDILINLDSEEEGELCVGCAGGLDGTFEASYDELNPAAGKAYKLGITGLKGGHSGADIHLGRGNANKIAMRILNQLTKKCRVQLASYSGGNLRNAIPREASATIVVCAECDEEVKKIVASITAAINAELALVDNPAVITLDPTEMPAKVVNPASQLGFISALLACPNAVTRMSDAMPGLVETSTNLAIVSIADGQLSVSALLRSSVDSAKEHLAECMEAAFSLAGVKSVFSGGYSGWNPNMKSPILQTMNEVYEQLYGLKPKAGAIHAGLECGMLGGLYRNLDMISCGPTIFNPHSPDERVEVKSVEKWWNFMLAALKSCPCK